MASGTRTPAESMSGWLETLETLSARGEHYAVLHVGTKHLGTGSAEVARALLVAKAFIALGLVGPGRELLQSVGRKGVPGPELETLLSQIARAPSGRVSWAGLRERFAGNAERLFRRHPELEAYRSLFERVPRELELYRSTDGNLHVARRSAGRREWLTEFRPARQVVASARLPHDPEALFCGPYLIVEDRLGELLERVHADTLEMFLTFSPRLYVLVPDPRLLGVVLYVAESLEPWCHARTELFVGDDLAERLADCLERRRDRLPPAYFVALSESGSALGRAVHSALEPVLAGRAAEEERTLARMESHYASLPRDHWRRRFAPERAQPLRVLGLTSRFTTYLQHSMRDWGAAFQAAGHAFRLLMEENDHDLLPPVRKSEVIAEFRPDLIVCIDHLRQEYGRYLPADVPFVCWIQDQLPNLTSPDVGRRLGPLDFYIAPERDHFVRTYGYPADRGLVWTMATSLREYGQEPLPEGELAPHVCDFSYVSNQSKPPEEFHREQQERPGQSEPVRRLRDWLFERLRAELESRPLTAFQRSARSWFEQAEREIGVRPATPEAADRFARIYLHRVEDLLFRQRTLAWVADYCDRTGRRLHLYGRGWEHHPRFARYARGEARNGRELRAVYQASRINLQIMPFGAVHQRLLDGLAAGGFFLLRRVPLDVMPEAVARLLTALESAGIEPDRPVRRHEAPEVVSAWEALAGLRGDPPPGDEIVIPSAELARFREMQAAGFRRCAGALFPAYEAVSFATPEEFAQRAERWLADPAAREETAAAMRRVVVEKFTYEALVRDLLAFIHERVPT